MKKINLLLPLVSILFLATACQKSFLYEADIDNQTAKDITFLFYDTSPPFTRTDSFVVAANKSYSLASETQDGEPNSVSCVAKALSTKSDRVVVRIDSTHTLHKDIQREQDWVTNSDAKSNTYKCSFIIKTADIQ
jgi:hypothetical protein